MAISSEYTYDIEAVLGADLTAQGRAHEHGGSFLGQAPQLMVTASGLTLLAAPTMPKQTWWQQLFAKPKPTPAIRVDFSLPDLSAHLRPGDHVQIFSDGAARKALIVRRGDSILLAVGEAAHELGITVSPGSTAGHYGYVQVAGKGAPLVIGEDREVNGLVVTLLNCTPSFISTHIVVLAAAHPSLPRSSILSWARTLGRM